jgi:hypothetical protein
MKFTTGGHYGIEAKDLEDNTVSVVAEDGRVMFAVILGEDGHSIEVRGSATCKVGGVLYDSRLLVQPEASNSIFIKARSYE